jgi:mRNA interferase HigB
MRLLGEPKLSAFGRRHPDSRTALSAWQQEAEDAVWRMPQDIKDRYRHASFLAGNRVIFNIRGGNYRLEVQVSYQTQTVLILRIGTHAEYENW